MKTETLKTVCAWCPDFDPNDPSNDTVSHGMCESCAAKWLTDDSGRAVAPAEGNVIPERPTGPWDTN